MEATGRDGGAGGPSWSYRRRHDTISSSSRSGTIVSSTAYTSRASLSSRLSSGISMEAAALLELELELKLGTPEPDEKDAEFAQAIKKHRKEIDEATLKETRMNRIESLVHEFFGGPSENYSRLGGGGGGMSALERWFSELRVSWVLQLDDVGVYMFERYSPGPDTEIWIRALTQIMEAIHLTECFFPNHGQGSVGMPGISEEEEVDSGKQAATSLDLLQFALFFQEAMSKMLVFVDVMITKSICFNYYVQDITSSVSSLNTCLKVNKALSQVLLGIRLPFHSSHPEEVEKIEKEMVSLLSAKQGKVFDAIWSFMEKGTTRALKSIDDELGTKTPQGSTDIHQATFRVMGYINSFLCICSKEDPLFLSQAASHGKHVPQTALGEAPTFICLIIEVVSCLEEKLIAKSQLFLDKGFGLLFLLNNSNFIRERLHDLSHMLHSLSHTKIDLAAVISFITPRVDYYTESYIQVSWEPMMACLFNPTPLRLVRKYSPLSKFESEFQKVYNTKIQWKVPDAELKKRLRKAVIEKIIPGYTKYIEDSKVTNPKFTPQELEEKLQELFEG